jgi:hypothetical protein
MVYPKVIPLSAIHSTYVVVSLHFSLFFALKFPESYLNQIFVLD